MKMILQNLHKKSLNLPIFLSQSTIFSNGTHHYLKRLFSSSLPSFSGDIISRDAGGPLPLEGIKVLELGQLIAGPFAACLLGYYGADVIKVEPPVTGDPIRKWRGVDVDGTSPWFRSLGRNKRSVAIDLKQKEGQHLVKRLMEQSDVVIENFKPGTMEKWGLGPNEFKESNPSLIYCRVSGYGQTGPYSKKPGFASVCEAFGGFRYVTGFPGDAPVRPNVSLGDSLAGLHAAFGVLLSLLARNKLNGKGQMVDVAIYESVFNMMEAIVPEYDRLGMIREPSGTTVTGIVPTNAYKCKDGKYIIIGANGDNLFKRLMTAAGREDMANDARFETNMLRVEAQKEIDSAIGTWTLSLTSEQVLKGMEKAKVPCGLIYNVKDMIHDPHYQQREMFEIVEHNNITTKIPAISPKLSETPGRTNTAGPDKGQHTKEIIKTMLQLSNKQIDELKSKKIIQ